VSRIIINTEHPRQDITREREYDPGRERYRFALELLPDAAPGARLLDVGGGAGEFTELARARGYATTLADGNPTSVDREAARGFDALRVDLNDGLPGVPDASFQLVSCLDVIEHVVPAERLLREIRRVLAPGGVLVLSTPNFGYLVDRLSYLRGRDVREEGYHFRFFTRRRLAGMLRAAGFRLERTNSVGSALGLNWMLWRASLHRVRAPRFRSPEAIEGWHAATFVWRAVPE
jgi:2-polyprenyl-3-methyl-5-hydroxy-6-metoxy-1,4-benzoquinol methylase